MRYLVWILRLAIFVLVLMFALKNTQPVSVTFFTNHVLPDVPLIVVMLAVFVLGAVFGVLLTIPAAMRRRRDIHRLQRDNERLQVLADGQSPTVILPPETIAPLSPL